MLGIQRSAACDSYKLSIGVTLQLLEGYRAKFHSTLWSPAVCGPVDEEVVSNSFAGGHLAADYMNTALFDLRKT